MTTKCYFFPSVAVISVKKSLPRITVMLFYKNGLGRKIVDPPGLQYALG